MTIEQLTSRVENPVEAGGSARRLTIFLVSQFISQAGGWGQIIALNWVVAQRGGGLLTVGLVTGCRQLPLLLMAPAARFVGDGALRRRTLIATQYGLLVLAAVLAFVVSSGSPSIAVLVAVSLGIGMLNGLANPLRQLFLGDLVPESRRPRAQALYSVMLSLSRLAGPAAAAAIIAWWSIEAAFVANALSFVVIIACLHTLRPPVSERSAALDTSVGIRAGFAADPGIRSLLVLVTAVSATALQLPVILTDYVTSVLGGDASEYATILAVSGAGSILAGLVMTRVPSTSVAFGRVQGAILAGVLLALAVLPGTAALAALLAVGGAAATACTVVAAARIQTAPAAVRCSLMPLYSMATLGVGAVAAPVVGLIAQQLGLRASLVGGSGLVLLACVPWPAGSRRRLPIDGG